MSEQPDQAVAAVIYGAKSTEDTHGSIATQLEDCAAFAARERWDVVGTFTDEAFSAYRGNRGPGLEKAKRLAVATANERGHCVLIAQDADRFARGAGDESSAADHLAEVYFSMRRQGVELWTVRSGRIDVVRAAFEGERSTDESARKSQATRAGLKRRKDRGQPVGPVPLGFRVDGEIVDGHAITHRVIDPGTRTTIDRIFDLVEAGSTFGDVARALNADGVVGRRGKPWISRTVRNIVYNRAYAGEKGYPALIEPGRYDAIIAGLKRMDPAAVQRRAGGRKPIDESYFLRGLLFCLSCGGTLYTRRQAVGRVYVCSNRRHGTGLCHAAPIPAQLIENHVLDHLDAFVGGAEEWLRDRVRERDGDRQRRSAAVDRLRSEAAAAQRVRDLALAEYETALSAGDPNARFILEVVAKRDADLELATAQIDDAEAVLAEWEDADVDEALDYFADIVTAVRDRVSAANGAKALNGALGQAVAGIWARVNDGRLRAEFQLRPHDGPVTERTNTAVRYLLARSQPVGLEAQRFTLPDGHDGRGQRPPSPSAPTPETGTSTFV